MEENAESKELQIKKLEATVRSLSEELIKVCYGLTPLMNTSSSVSLCIQTVPHVSFQPFLVSYLLPSIPSETRLTVSSRSCRERFEVSLEK